MDALITLNLAISEAEAHGDKAFFERCLAPEFAIRRASGAIHGRQAFIDAVASSPSRATTIHSISALGVHRALVVCTIAMIQDGATARFDNVRLFVRASDEADWLLLAWANERVAE